MFGFGRKEKKGSKNTQKANAKDPFKEQLKPYDIENAKSDLETLGLSEEEINKFVREMENLYTISTLQECSRIAKDLLDQLIDLNVRKSIVNCNGNTTKILNAYTVLSDYVQGKIQDATDRIIKENRSRAVKDTINRNPGEEKI